MVEIVLKIWTILVVKIVLLCFKMLTITVVKNGGVVFILHSLPLSLSLSLSRLSGLTMTTRTYKRDGHSILCLVIQFRLEGPPTDCLHQPKLARVGANPCKIIYSLGQVKLFQRPITHNTLLYSVFMLSCLLFDSKLQEKKE